MSDKHQVIYLAGPMQGYAEFNFPLFNAVAWALREDGSTVFNPAEKDIERHDGADISKGNNEGSLDKVKASHGFSLRAALADDLKFICEQANCIVLLPGWEKSNGAMAEHRTAVALLSEGMEIIYLHKDVTELMKLAYADHLNRQVPNAA